MQQFFEFFLNHWPLFVALLAIAVTLAYNIFGNRLHGYQNVEPLSAVQLMNHEDAVVVDVREDREFKEGHIADAIHIPLGALGSRVGELEKYRDRPVIVGCRSGARSARASGMLSKQGFEKVYNLQGGIMAWQQANLPVVTPGKRKGKKKR
jgi:rhodanese-related sulfurtransferase